MNRAIVYNGVNLEMVRVSHGGDWALRAHKVHTALGYATKTVDRHLMGRPRLKIDNDLMVRVADIPEYWGNSTAARKDNLVGLMAIINFRITGKWTAIASHDTMRIPA